jgi:hypothetical protein
MTTHAAVFTPAPLPTNPTWPSRSRWLVLALVLALHALLLWFVGTQASAPPLPRWTPHEATAHRRMQTRWIAAPPVQENASRPHATDLASRPAPMNRPALDAGSGTRAPHAAPAAVSLKRPPAVEAASPLEGEPPHRGDARPAPMPDHPAAAPATAGEAQPASPPAAFGAQATGVAPPPLDLRLPAAGTRMMRSDSASPQSMRDQALNDPHSNVRPASLEERIASATTRNDKLQVENRGEGRKRVSMHGQCWDVHQARISQIDPINDVSRRTMSTAKPCEE